MNTGNKYREESEDSREERMETTVYHLNNILLLSQQEYIGVEMRRLVDQLNWSIHREIFEY